MSPHGIFEGRTTHRIKSQPEQFTDAINGRKTFEIRRDDRPYNTGDLVVLQEWRPPEPDEPAPGYTGRSIMFLVGYVERSSVVPAGWCGFELIAVEVAARIAAAVISPRNR